MNHEFSGEKPAEKTENTEWDKLGEDVVFENLANESEESEKSESEKFVEENYGDKINKIVDNACFDGGERSDPDCYVVSMKLGYYLSDDEQLKAIELRAHGEDIPVEMREKITKKLSEQIEKSNIHDELVEDPFLRWRRVDFLAGRDSSTELSEEDEVLKEILWCADDKFGESNEGLSLLSDAGFLKNKYGTSDEDLRIVSRHMQRMVENGQTSVDELISDPYLRKKHFDSLIETEQGKSFGGEIAQLWDSDREFMESYDYWMYLNDHARRNPDIYENPDQDDIDRFTGEALSQLSEEDIDEVLKNYEKNSRKGDRFLFNKLLPVLGLDDNPPALVYEPGEDVRNGYYSRIKHRVVICEDTIDNRKPDSKDVMSVGSIFDFLKPKKLDDKKFYRMNVIAHELWHAHQWAGNGVDEAHRSKYLENFVYYMDTKNGYDNYRSQLLEKEAWTFGDTFEKRCREQYNEGKDKK